MDNIDDLYPEYEVDFDILGNLYRNSHLQKSTPYSPYARFQEVSGLPVYRVDNPYQRLVDISQAPRFGRRVGRKIDGREARFLDNRARLSLANRNLDGKCPFRALDEIFQ